MNEKELGQLRVFARMLALEAISSWQTQIIQALLLPLEPAARSHAVAGLKKKLSQFQEGYSTLTLDGYPPEWSDLVAAEFQDAFGKICKEIVEYLE